MRSRGCRRRIMTGCSGGSRLGCSSPSPLEGEGRGGGYLPAQPVGRRTTTRLTPKGDDEMLGGLSLRVDRHPLPCSHHRMEVQ